MEEGKQPFIWIPVATEEQESKFQLKSSASSQAASKEITMSGLSESRKIAPISRNQLDEMVKGFEGYEVDSIELNIVGGIETGGLLQFIVAGKAEAGMTVILKKKGAITPDNP